MLIPPASESPRNDRLYRHFSAIRDRALESMTGDHQPVDDTCLHLTVADLIAGPMYRLHAERIPNLDGSIQNRIKTVFKAQPRVIEPLRWQIAGLAFFQHAVVCLLKPVDEVDYAPLMRLRDDIYTDPRLQSLGVRRPRPFLAHITLAYYQEIPSEDARLMWVNAYSELQTFAQSVQEPLLLRSVGLRHFEDMTHYVPCAPPIALSFGPTGD